MAQTPGQLGINASTTGGVFKDAAWYSGRQYDAASGTLGDPGQIWSKSVGGTGNMVDPTTMAASSSAAGLAPDAYSKYIAAGAPVTGYKDLPAVQTALNKTQNSVYTSGNNITPTVGGGSAPTVPGVQTTDQIAADLKASGLLPETTAPTAPSMVDTYAALADKKGIDALNASINDLKTQADALVAQTRTNTSAEQGKPVATNIIEGRVTVQKTAAQEQLDFINRQLTTKQNELTSALGNIKMIMDFTQTDYTNASDSYNSQFKQAIDTINLIHGIQQDQKTDVQKAQDNARANAQIMVNAIKDGNMDLAKLPPDQQAQLSTLEVQAGLPVGFFQSLRMDAKANIISTSTDNGVTQVLMRNPDGSIGVQTYGTSTAGSGGKPGSAQYIANSRTNIINGLNAAKNSSGNVAPNVFKAAQAAWIADVGDNKAFLDNFASFADPNRGDFNKAYGFVGSDYGITTPNQP